jgi:hypothetical protein
LGSLIQPKTMFATKSPLRRYRRRHVALDFSANGRRGG